MKLFGTGLAGLLASLAAASLAQAQYYPPHGPPPRLAPDTCSMCGFYTTGPCGMTYGPSYYLQPPFPPFNGVLPVAMPKDAGAGMPPPWAAGPIFPTHPYARSPRDYFMLEP